MKLVMAIIRPHTLGVVQRTLDELGIEQSTFSSVLGRGHERRSGLIYRAQRSQESNIERLQLQILVDDASVDSVIDAIQVGAKTGRVGDGVIMVLPVETMVRIRSGERKGEKTEHLPGAKARQRSRLPFYPLRLG
jgi:nitrogen regulatory protein P-II 1